MITLNNRQLKSITTILDNVATATIIALFVGAFIDSKVGMIESIILASIAIECIVLSLMLNNKGEDDV